MYELSKCAPQEALRNLDAAFRNFFDGRTRFPKFKTRKRGAGSFTRTGAISVGPDRVRLPRIGWVRLKERGYIPSKKVHINSATVSERAGRWFVSVNVLEDVGGAEGPTPVQVLGVDSGIERLLVASDGTSIENPGALLRHRRKLKQMQRSLSRKKKDSANRKKAIQALRRVHCRIANARKDAINKATTMRAKTKSVIVVEDLNVRGMMANHRLAGSVADEAMGEVVRQLSTRPLGTARGWSGPTGGTRRPRGALGAGT
jgi:putative transposase